MRNDATGIPYTCPIIDDVKEYLKYVERNFISKIDNDEDKKNEIDDSNTILDTLEDIRTANDELRSFGLKTIKELEEAINERDEFEKTIEDLKSEIFDLKQDIKNLQYEE